MTRRPKLSLEPNRHLRSTPPDGFKAIEVLDTDRQGAESSPSDASSAGGDRVPLGSVEAETRGPMPRPRPPIGTHHARPPEPESRGPLFDKATLIKALLAAGLAAISILLLRRRL